MIPKPFTTPNLWLFRFAALTALFTFLLLGAGGLVTSHEAGMSVPDWPNSYGYNMFLFPPSKWIGGIFYEHTHRLWATVVGFMTTVLMVWLYRSDERAWVKKLGVAAFLGVVIQGVLGGLRVTLRMDDLGIFHGIVAQSFFVLTCALALFTSPFWFRLSQHPEKQGKLVAGGLRRHVAYVAGLIFLQLILGATMRHQHAGLSISDFPLAHGQLWPDTSPAAIARYNADRVDPDQLNPITAFQVILQMIHRIMALLIVLGVAAAAMLSLKRLGKGDYLTRLAFVWLGLILVQAGLGIMTVLSNKAADVATAHVLVGALVLAVGAVWFMVASVRREEAVECESGTLINPSPSVIGAE